MTMWEQMMIEHGYQMVMIDPLSRHLELADYAERIALACGKGRRTSHGYVRCCCPSHNDQRPSLMIVIKSDGLSVRCLAGCPAWRVRLALKRRGIIDLSQINKQARSTPLRGDLTYTTV